MHWNRTAPLLLGAVWLGTEAEGPVVNQTRRPLPCRGGGWRNLQRVSIHINQVIFHSGLESCGKGQLSVAYICNPASQEAEAGRWLQVQGQPGLVYTAGQPGFHM